MASIELASVRPPKGTVAASSSSRDQRAVSSHHDSDASGGDWSGGDDDYVDEERGELNPASGRGGRRGKRSKWRSVWCVFCTKLDRAACRLISIVLAPLRALHTRVRALLDALTVRLLRIPTMKRLYDWSSPVRTRLMSLSRKQLIALWFIKLLLTSMFLWIFSGDAVPRPYGMNEEWQSLPRGDDDGVSNLELPSPEHAAAFAALAAPALARSGVLTSMAASEDESALYSRMQCIGGEGTTDRSCRFQNLCYRFHDRQWRYFADPAEQLHEFSPHFLSLASSASQDATDSGGSWWTPQRVTNESISRDWFPSRNSSDETASSGQADVFVYYAPTDPLSPPRLFAHDLLPLYQLLRRFDLASNPNSVQLLLPYDCDALYGAPQYDKRNRSIIEDEYTEAEAANQSRCKHGQNVALAGLSSRRPLVLSSLVKHQARLEEHLSWDPDTTTVAQSTSDEDEHICFPDLLIGLGPSWTTESMTKNRQLRAVLRDFRETYLHNLEAADPSQSDVADEAASMQSNRITLLASSSSSPVTVNFDQVLEHLRAEYALSDSSTPAPVVEVVDMHAMGWSATLQRISRTSVLVAHAGEDNVLAMFLPPRSALVLLDTSAFESVRNVSVTAAAALSSVAMQRMAQREAFEAGRGVQEPAPTESSIKKLSFRLNTLASLGLWRTFDYKVTTAEVEPVPSASSEDSTSETDGAVLRLRLDPLKLSKLIVAAKRRVDAINQA